MLSIKYVLYKDSNNICQVKIYITKKIYENNNFSGLNFLIVANKNKEI